YPCLSCMAADYLTIPATLVNVEQLFSCGQLILLHVHSWLSMHSTHALLCLSVWSELSLVKNEDVRKVTELPDAVGVEELKEGWDSITLK
ncbi:hypothetical protein PAXRUDRAFT_147492, partial [Paxillus rubicundulus Ve08.2h10]